MKKGTLSAMVFALLPGLLAWNATAASPPGTVNFRGELLATPCRLAPGADGEDVKVDFGTMERRDIEKSVIKRPFTLKLTGCVLNGQMVEITFTSSVAMTDSIFIRPEGDTNLMITTDEGIAFNQPFSFPASDGDNTASFTAVLMAVASYYPEEERVKPGAFSTVVGLLLTYK